MTAALSPVPQRTQPGNDQMFLFFSNRLGCLGSLLLSAVLTIVLILIFTR